MVITVNLNPNVDRLVKINKFIYGGMNRILEKRDDVCSKGMNVAQVLKRLGHDTLCTGFIYRDNGALATEILEKEGIAHDYVWQPGAIRMNMKVLDTSAHIITEINDKGVPVTPEYLYSLREKVLSYAREGNYIVFIGSMPPGCPAETFAGLIREAGARGAKCVLDAEGEILKKGVAGKPYFVKVNRFELETYAGEALAKDSRIVEECAKIIETGVKLVAVSLGGDGAILTDGHEAYKADPLPIEPISPTGAGDSMIAGILKGLLEGWSLSELLKSGTAAATATVLREGTQLMTRDLYDKLICGVVLHKIK